MKKNLLFLASVMICILCACDGDNDNPSAEGQANIELKNFANTGCKNETRSVEGMQTFEYSCIHENYLYVSHNNVVFNCCPGELKADISVVGNDITISEWSTENFCRCLCNYDLSYEIGPLVEGKTYTLSIGYKGMEQKIAVFTFSNSMSGHWEIEGLSRRDAMP
jgi:hypothetical protein